MAHIPLIHGPDGAKLSKRHGALGVEAYRAMGYLPEAMRNYLARLGWSHGDDEIMSTRADDRVVRHRRHQQGRGALRLRQAREPQRPLHARAWPTPICSRVLIASLPHLAGRHGHSPHASTPERAAQLQAAMPGLKERAKTLRRTVDGAAFLFAERPLAARRQAAARCSTPTPRAILADARAALDAVAATGRAAPLEAARASLRRARKA